MLRSLDIWRCAIIKTPAADLQQSDLRAENLIWLPDLPTRFTFRADPFGLWHDDKLHIFVERFDHRVRKGEIEVLIFDSDLKFVDSRLVLQAPWHLSYPFVFRDGDDIWMLPEANRSGKLMLYRASSFPSRWEPASTLNVPGDALDATPFFHDGSWWLLYGLGPRGALTTSLNFAYSDHLTGPWHDHPLNPIQVGLRGTRPAGTPIIREGVIDVPVQDSSRTYGGAVRRLRILGLDRTHFEVEDTPWLEPSPALSPFTQGLHTISSAANISLIDCKFVDRSICGTLAWRQGKLARSRRQRSGEEIRTR